jgi:hypothetical protein
MYVGTKGILDLALPFAAMTGMTIPADKIPEKLPPIAGGLSAQGNGLRFTMVIPAPVLKTGVYLGMEAQKAMEAPPPPRGRWQRAAAPLLFLDSRRETGVLALSDSALVEVCGGCAEVRGKKWGTQHGVHVEFI